MENAMILLYDVCRLCLDEPGVDNIFKPVDWSHDIFTYTGVKVHENDKLPQTICTSCRDIMNCAKVLREIAKKNDHRLNSIISTDPEGYNQVDQVSNIYIMMSRARSSCHQNETRHSTDIFLANETVKSTFFESAEGKVLNGSSDNSVTDKSSKKKRRSSKPESIKKASKTISVRKDLFDSSTIVSSSTKKNETSPHSSKCAVNKSNTEANVHKCETCNKRYASAKKLYLHQYSHNKKFLCPLDACLKRFASKGDLQKHIRCHTGEKPYRCDLCDQRFSQNVSLKQHKDNVHVEQHN